MCWEDNGVWDVGFRVIQVREIVHTWCEFEPACRTKDANKWECEGGKMKHARVHPGWDLIWGTQESTNNYQVAGEMNDLILWNWNQTTGTKKMESHIAKRCTKIHTTLKYTDIKSMRCLPHQLDFHASTEDWMEISKNAPQFESQFFMQCHPITSVTVMDHGMWTTMFHDVNAGHPPSSVLFFVTQWQTVRTHRTNVPWWNGTTRPECTPLWVHKVTAGILK